MKYIITETIHGLPAAVLFNETLQHKDVAKPFAKVTGAGFCDATGKVWGYSQSLDIHSQPQDAAHVRLAISFTTQQ